MNIELQIYQLRITILLYLFLLIELLHKFILYLKIKISAEYYTNNWKISKIKRKVIVKT